MRYVLRPAWIGAVAALLLTACGGGGGGGSSPASTPPPTPTVTGAPVPLANAPASVSAYSTVTLDGTLSREKTASVTLSSYAWSQTAGPSVTLAAANTAQASFTAPQVTAPTTLTFSLTVTDSAGANAKTSISMTVKPTGTVKAAVRVINVRLFTPVSNNFHVDVAPADGPPLAGSSMILQVTMSGYTQSPTFTLIDATGKSLSTVILSLSGPSSVQPLDYAGTITIPSVPFSVSAQGSTADGQSFNLPSTTVFIPMQMTVGFSPSRLLLAKATTGTSQLQIFNGTTASGSFTVQFTDPWRLLGSSGANQSVTVPAGQSASVPVTVTMPSSFSTTFSPKVTVTVTNTSATGQSGAATLTTMLNGAP